MITQAHLLARLRYTDAPHGDLEGASAITVMEAAADEIERLQSQVDNLMIQAGS